MPASGEPKATGFVPVLRYRDVGAAADWLCRAFGFVPEARVVGEDGTVVYALLASGAGVIMLVPVGESELDKLMCQPEDNGGFETQACYVPVSDAEAHHGVAEAAGATIVLGLTSDDSGRAGYTCRDLEGHVWSFGTYDPGEAVRRKASAAASPGARADEEDSEIVWKRKRPRLAQVAIVTGLVLTAALAVETGSGGGAFDLTKLFSSGVTTAAGPAPSGNPTASSSAKTAAALAALEAEAKELRRALETQKSEHAAALGRQEAEVRALAEKNAKLESKVMNEMAKRDGAEQALKKAEDLADTERKGRLAAEQAIHAVERQLEQDMIERAAKAEAAEKDRVKPAMEAAPPAAAPPSTTSALPERQEAASTAEETEPAPRVAPEADAAKPDDGAEAGAPPRSDAQAALDAKAAEDAKAIEEAKAAEKAKAEEEAKKEQERLAAEEARREKARSAKKARVSTPAVKSTPAPKKKSYLEPQEKQWPFTAW